MLPLPLRAPHPAHCSREGGRPRRPTVSGETSPYNSLSRGKSASALPPYDPNSPSLPAPLLLTTKLTASENALSSPNSGKVRPRPSAPPRCYRS